MAAASRLAQVIFTAAAVFATDALAQPTVDAIEHLLRLGQAQNAYELALRRSDKEAGNPRFDMALARAAIAAGHPDQAVFALERVLAAQPENHAAYLELARAELMLENPTGAQKALDSLLAQNPPESTRNEAVALMRKARVMAPRASSGRVHAYTEIKYGYDTNVNSASSLTSVDVFTPGQVTQVTTAPAMRDQFGQFDLGMEGDTALGTGGLLFGNLVAAIRNNDDSDTFDSDSYDARVGVSYARSNYSIRLTGQMQRYDLDDAYYRRLKLLVPDWGLRLSASNQVYVFGQFGNIHYPQQPQRDVDLMLAGAAWAQRFGGTNQVTLSLYGAEEEAGDDSDGTARKHFGRDFAGWRLRWQSRLAAAHTTILGAGAQTAEHAAVDPTFMVTREDRLRIAEAGWHWRFAPAWGLKAELNYYKNRSNISLYQYSRTQTQLALRYDFF